MANMLDTEVHTFLDIAVSNYLVNNDTNRIRCNIIHNSGSSVDQRFQLLGMLKVDRLHTRDSICAAYPFVVRRLPLYRRYLLYDN